MTAEKDGAIEKLHTEATEALKVKGRADASHAKEVKGERLLAVMLNERRMGSQNEGRSGGKAPYPLLLCSASHENFL